MKDHAVAPREIAEKSLCFDADIAHVLHRAAELKRGESFETQDDVFKTECEMAFPAERALWSKLMPSLNNLYVQSLDTA